jgi:hypothetical protein
VSIFSRLKWWSSDAERCRRCTQRIIRASELQGLFIVHAATVADIRSVDGWQFQAKCFVDFRTGASQPGYVKKTGPGGGINIDYLLPGEQVALNVELNGRMVRGQI